MDDKNSKWFRFPQVCKVEASAGSGKTYTLAKRYIQLLINPYLKPDEIPLNTILAITFTNKAAIEMKERILEFLKKIALDKFKDQKEKEDILSSLAVDEQVARKKAYKIMDNLIKNYNFFQVQTIDSFINAILCGCAFRLDLSASFKTERNYQQYLSYSLDKLIDKAHQDRDILRLFHRFLKQYLYIENKTGWFPKQNIQAAITSLFLKSNRYTGKFIRNDVEPEALFSRKKAIIKLMHELNEGLPRATHKSFSNNLSAFLEENKESFDIDRLSDFFKRDDFPAKKGQALPLEIIKLWKKLKKNIRQLCELESSSVFNYYVDIFNNVLYDLKKISSDDNILFLEALNKEAASLFDEKSLGLPELYYRLATRFKHFLLDEFQDTSTLQWKNLYPMVEEALSTDGSLFFVGDRKQAIYRFRGGEVSLMDSVKKVFQGFNLIEEILSRNYRSQKVIVEFNNLTFSQDNLRRFLKQRQDYKRPGLEFAASDIDEILHIFREARQIYKEEKIAGFVKSEFLDYSTKEERQDVLKDKLFNLVEDLRKRFSLNDIALLVRTNDEVELLTSWLLEKDIPVESEKTLDIRQNSYIKELVSFLKFLNSPIDNLSFASFILGDIFTCASKLTPQQIQDFIFELRGKSKQGVYLYREFRVEFPESWDGLIEEFFKSVGLVPLYELVISILNKFNCLNNFPDYQGFFMRFLELIKEQEEDRPSISGFLEFFEQAQEEDDMYVNVTQGDCLKILTIHKSKGLEFPVVIIPFLEMNVKTDPGVVLGDIDGLRLIYNKKKYADFSGHLAQLYRDEYRKAFIDELNSIYVAFTRAIDELYIFVGQKAERGFNLASLLLPQKDLELGERSGHKKAEGRKEAGTIKIPIAAYEDWIRLLKDEFIDAGILRAREKVLKGEILHCILSFIGNLYNQDKAGVVKSALEKAKVSFSFIRDFKEFESSINKLLDNKSFLSYFEIKDGLIYTEKDIVNSLGDTKRIDRLILKPKEAIIVDYKSTREQNNDYRQQLLEYMKIIQDIYPDLEVKGVLIYLDDMSVEEVNG
jgi:ATP-dependent exoDNAse (exonuclease V) beta subunit